MDNLPNINIGDKALITTDAWFYGPDGGSYRAVFGTVKSIRSSEQTLGIKTNFKSTNWYVEIGNMVIAGCQIHYAIRTDKCNNGSTEDWNTDSGKPKVFRRPTCIYFADEVYTGKKKKK